MTEVEQSDLLSLIIDMSEQTLSYLEQDLVEQAEQINKDKLNKVKFLSENCIKNEFTMPLLKNFYVRYIEINNQIEKKISNIKLSIEDSISKKSSSANKIVAYQKIKNM